MSSPCTGKWIDAASAGVLAVDVAHDALRLRLAYVEQMLPLAAYRYEQNVEHVHRLRVGCRRASAALSAFRPLIPGEVRPLRRWLRRLRRGAGPARDADVMLARFRSEESNHDSLMPFLIRQLEKSRGRAQGRLMAVEVKAQAGGLKRAIEKCLGAIERCREPDSTTFGSFGLAALAPVVGEMFAAAEVSEPSVDQLHQLRIAGKRVRYSIELFHSAFPKSLRRHIYPQVEELQERLGMLNDRAASQRQLQMILARTRPGTRAVEIAGRIVHEHEEAEAAREVFLRWWTPQRIATLRNDLESLL